MNESWHLQDLPSPSDESCSGFVARTVVGECSVQRCLGSRQASKTVAGGRGRRPIPPVSKEQSNPASRRGCQTPGPLLVCDPSRGRMGILASGYRRCRPSASTAGYRLACLRHAVLAKTRNFKTYASGFPVATAYFLPSGCFERIPRSHSSLKLVASFDKSPSTLCRERLSPAGAST